MIRPRYLLGLLFVVACGKDAEPPPASTPAAPTPSAPAVTAPAPASESAAQEAKKTFVSVCSVCHGVSGKGDGAGAANLEPKPRDYTDKAWQATVTDDEIRKIIVEGGAAVGKSAVMPAHPQLADKPEVVNELVKLVRLFGQ